MLDCVGNTLQQTRENPIPNMSTCRSLQDENSRQKHGTDELRSMALKRLYSRIAVVDDLIRSLEQYERFPVRKARAECIPFRKCS
jgi:hypothetical protein